MSQRPTDSAATDDPGVEANLMRPGGLSYLEIPATDPERSAAFYAGVLGWDVDWRSPGDARFRDVTGHLIGRWTTGRAAAPEPGLLPYCYVEDIDGALARVAAHGGMLLGGPDPEGSLWVARVRDPAGNVIGLWQAGPRRDGPGRD
ncbi:MAG TPA: VOC family protein [Thermomicrobiaceae bacterium]|nr:VOC family protein [Thermomicrobiaceae bacterium]